MEPSCYVEKNPESRRAPLANDVANKLVSFIQENHYTPGTRIPSEFELAEHFQVGRGTIREAVKLLISRNVLEIRPAKGTFVCEKPGITVDPLGLQFVQDKSKMIRDLLELRVVLESYAIRNAVYNATEEDIAKLMKYADNIEQNQDNNDICIQNDIEFHKCIAESCGNSVISIVLPIIRTSMEHFNKMDFAREWHAVNKGHYAIIEAIKVKKPLLAEAEIVNHLNYVSEKMKELG